jgi:hypothetical protein
MFVVFDFYFVGTETRFSVSDLWPFGDLRVRLSQQQQQQQQQHQHRTIVQKR